MITTEMLNRRFEAFAAACQLAGICPPAGHRWGLDKGSKLYGRAYRVFWVNLSTGGHHSPGSMFDFLGMTKAEAYEALGQRLTVLWAVANNQAPSCEPVEPAEYLDGIETARNVTK
jgi:hypothetical protein